MVMSVHTLLQYRDASVVYFDTEQKFSTKRLLEIAKHRMLSNLGRTTEYNLQEMMRRIHLIKATSAMDLFKSIQRLEGLIAESDVRLIVVDSIAALARRDFNSDEIPQRQALLVRKASILKYYAGTYNIPVLTTNQASQHTRSFVTPALGNSWSHSVNTRVRRVYHLGVIILLLLAIAGKKRREILADNQISSGRRT